VTNNGIAIAGARHCNEIFCMWYSGSEPTIDNWQ